MDLLRFFTARFFTAGSVDDGKSTLGALSGLISRMLSILQADKRLLIAIRLDDKRSKTAMEDRKKQGYF